MISIVSWSETQPLEKRDLERIKFCRLDCILFFVAVKTFFLKNNFRKFFEFTTMTYRCPYQSCNQTPLCASCQYWYDSIEGKHHARMDFLLEWVYDEWLCPIPTAIFGMPRPLPCEAVDEQLLLHEVSRSPEHYGQIDVSELSDYVSSSSLSSGETSDSCSTLTTDVSSLELEEESSSSSSKSSGETVFSLGIFFEEDIDPWPQSEDL